MNSNFQSPIIPPTTPTFEESNKNKKLTIFWVSIILIGLLIGSYFVYRVLYKDKQNANLVAEVQDQIQTQKLITLEDFGVSIASTTGWNIENINSNEESIVTSLKYTSPDLNKSFIVSVFGIDPEVTTMAQWAKQDALRYDNNAKEDQKNTYVGKNVGVIYIGEINEKSYKRAYLIKGVQGQIFRFNTEINKNNSWMSEFDGILSSIKLFETKTSTTTIYKNIQFAFELALPSTWMVREDSSRILLRNYYNPVLDLLIDSLDINIVYLKDKNPNQLSIQEWIKIGSNSVYVVDKNNLKKVNIGDEAVESVGETALKTPGKSLVTYVVRNGKDILYASYVRDEFITYVHNPEEILSSLKFTAFDKKTYDSVVQKENNKVIGIDVDKDGVWDYIQQWIDKNYSGNIRKSLRLMAQEVQFDLLNYRNKESISKHAHETYGIDCLFKAESDVDKASKISHEFQTQMINTEDRMKAYFQADEQKGGSYSSPDDSTLIKYCGF